MCTGPDSGRSISSARSGRISNGAADTGSEGTPLRWPLRRRGATPIVDFLVLSQGNAAREEEAYANALVDLRAWIRDSANAAGVEVDSAEYACTSLDAKARTGFRAMGFEVRRGALPVHLSHTYVEGSAALDAIEGIVRGTAGTYTGPHGKVLAHYRRAIAVVYNLLAYDRDPRGDHDTRTAAIWAFEKPPHDVIRYDAFDPFVGRLVDVTRGRDGSGLGAAWRGKLGLARTPEFWVEWRRESPFTFRELGDGFRAWRAPRAVKARVAVGWRLLATRIA